MEKKKFTQPQMKVVNMATEQVIAASGDASVKNSVNTASIIVNNRASNW